MVTPPTRLWHLSKTTATDTVNYDDLDTTNNRIPGAFRLVQVAPLLWSTPRIVVWQFDDIVYDERYDYKQKFDDIESSGTYRYVAVTHVWDYADDVDSQMNNLNIDEELDIDIDAPDKKHIDKKSISWIGLRQVALAAQMSQLGAVDYFWLDFLCLDQIDKYDNNGHNDKEMSLQIAIMGQIYEKAHAVLTMIGGIPAVQAVNQRTAWMDRAWTLQESVLNPNTWIYIKWPRLHLTVPKSPSPGNWVFYRVPLPTVLVLDGMTKKAGDIPRRALRACLSSKPSIKYTGVWRSMFMRTSSKPVDVVYSIMHIFKTHIDPYRKNRKPEFVFNDLARKTAAKTRVGPVWLTIGGVWGSEIERDDYSYLVPKFPHTQDANIQSDNSPPKMGFGTWWEWTGFHLDDSPYFINRYDIKFLTHSHPHNIAARMLRVTGMVHKPGKTFPRFGAAKPARRKRATMDLGAMTGGTCIYNGDIPKPSKNPYLYALYVGQVADMSSSSWGSGRVRYAKPPPPGSNFSGRKYLVFVNWNKKHKRWDVVADGVYLAPSSGWIISSTRMMLTIGEGAQKRHKKWPLPSYLANTDDIPTGGHPTWRKRYVNYNIKDLVRHEDRLVRRLKHHSALKSLSARSSSPPRTLETFTPVAVTNDAATAVPYSYDGWTKGAAAIHSRNGTEGILLPKSRSHRGRIRYFVRIWFGRYVMYVQIKFHRLAKSEYWTMLAVPYRRRGVGGFITNGDYIESPVPEYPYTPQGTSQPSAWPVYQPVVPIALPIFIPLYVPIFYPIGFLC
ncbi:hypothetical protein EJ04DRAFT_468378 [Polyplosphaeria fusca]|uniref:Heterokaryon incompatibility domain-containing protein n=1 Tax=Polyplosphaeria fusca TaxID=682080 RepID=A0A9P4QTC1_9PLEO|nr:hypothetical protein EJ04DRAFT_468378 [Polyplosphaeria fusca]